MGVRQRGRWLLIEVETLSRRYGGLLAVDELSFVVQPGEVMGLLGPNGAGKTTTLRILCGCLGASSGTVRIAGHDIARDSRSARASLGYLPEKPPLYDEMSVGDFVDHAARLRGVDGRARPAAVDRALALTDLSEVRGRIVGHLSNGFRQRVGLAQALVHAPSVLVLDEPTSGLDPSQMSSMRALIQELRGEQTILLSTHLLSEATTLCDRVTILAGGRLVASGTETELREQLLDGLAVRLEITGNPAACAVALSSLEPVLRAEAGDGEVLVTLRHGGAEHRVLVNAEAARFGLVSSQPAEGLEQVFLRAVQRA